MRRTLLGLVAACTLVTVGCTPRANTVNERKELLVFAAASLRDALTEVGTHFESQPHGWTVQYNYAGSNALAQQLIAAPRADVFLSASEAWMDRVEKAGVLVEGSRTPLLSNELVVIAHQSSPWQPSSVCELLSLDFDHLAVGNPDAVPVGVYAKQYLQKTSCPPNGSLDSEVNAWSVLEPRVLPTPDVRAALVQVEMSQRIIGVTYRTDANASDKVRILFPVTGKNAPRIVYPVALVRDQSGPLEKQFLSYLQSPEVSTIFKRHGFTPLAQASAHNE